MASSLEPTTTLNFNDMIPEVIALAFEFLDARTLTRVERVSPHWQRVMNFFPQLKRLREFAGLYAVGGMPRHQRTQHSNMMQLPLQCVPDADTKQQTSRAGWFGVMGEWQNASRVPDVKAALLALEDAQERCILDWDTKVDVSAKSVSIWHCCQCIYNRRLFMFGGRNDHERLNTAMYFDFMKSEWHVLPRMRESRSAPTCYAHKGYIYVLGGYDGHKEKDSVEVLHVAEKKWLSEEEAHKMMPPMLLPCTEHTVCGFHDYMYVVCGTQKREQVDETTLNVTQVFNFKTKKWAILPAQHTSRLTACAFIRRSSTATRLVVFGGGTERSEQRVSVETLSIDPDTGLAKTPSSPNAEKDEPSQWSMMKIASDDSCSCNQFCAVDAGSNRLVWMVSNAMGLFCVDLEKGKLLQNGSRKGGNDDGNWLEAIINADILHAFPAPFEAGKILFVE